MPVTFLSKANHFQVTLETAGIPMRDSNGIVVDRTPGKRVEFTRGTYVANQSEAMRLGFASEDELVTALRTAKTYDAEFFEMGNQPGAENPTLDAQMEAIAVASAKQDAAQLREVLTLERDTYQRPSVVNAAQRALGVLGDTEVGKRPAGRPRKEPLGAQ